MGEEGGELGDEVGIERFEGFCDEAMQAAAVGLEDVSVCRVSRMSSWLMRRHRSRRGGEDE